MNTLLKTAEFDAWLSGLKDMMAKVRIVARIRNAEAGNFGDSKSVGDGVSEMRIDVGAGYRVYFTRRGEVVYLLLLGGDKSTQDADIKKAKKMAQGLKGQGHDQNHKI